VLGVNIFKSQKYVYESGVQFTSLKGHSW